MPKNGASKSSDRREPEADQPGEYLWKIVFLPVSPGDSPPPEMYVRASYCLTEDHQVTLQRDKPFPGVFTSGSVLYAVRLDCLEDAPAAEKEPMVVVAPWSLSPDVLRGINEVLESTAAPVRLGWDPVGHDIEGDPQPAAHTVLVTADLGAQAAKALRDRTRRSGGAGTKVS